MNGIYEDLADSVVAHPASYTIMECVLASGLLARKVEMQKLQARFDAVVDRLLDAELRYERGFVGRI